MVHLAFSHLIHVHNNTVSLPGHTLSRGGNGLVSSPHEPPSIKTSQTGLVPKCGKDESDCESYYTALPLLVAH